MMRPTHLRLLAICGEQSFRFGRSYLVDTFDYEGASPPSRCDLPPQPILASGTSFAAFFLNRTSRSGILAGGAIGGKAQAGEYKMDARFNREDLATRVLVIGAMHRQITVLGMDALDLLQDCSRGFQPKTLVYLDPPYYIKGSQLYRNFYKHNDHQAIAQCVATAQYPLLVSYDNCPQIRRLYKSLRSSTFTLQYSTHLARPTAKEVLFYANLALPSRPVLTRSEHLRMKTSSERYSSGAAGNRRGPNNVESRTRYSTHFEGAARK